MTITTIEERRRRGRERHVWQERIAAGEGLSAAFRLLAIRLSMHKNLDTGRCFAGYQTLADETLTTIRSVMRQVATLERLGWIAVTRGGGSGKANEYRLLIPETTETMTGVSRFKAAGNSDSTGLKTMDRGVTPIWKRLLQSL
jgi:hypothetical protein